MAVTKYGRSWRVLLAVVALVVALSASVVAATTGIAAAQARTGAICMDGWRSYSTGSGTCSHHGGVDYWLYDDGPAQSPLAPAIPSGPSNNLPLPGNTLTAVTVPQSEDPEWLTWAKEHSGLLWVGGGVAALGIWSTWDDKRKKAKDDDK